VKILLKSNKKSGGFSLAETVVSLALTATTIIGVVTGFLQSSQEAEWSSWSLAAQSQALRCLEQARAAKWDPQGFPAVDEVLSTNFPVRIEVLDIPMSGNNVTYVTNRTTISTVSVNPPLKMIRVDSTWSFMNRGVFTNRAFTYRAPDQ
jgi:type II secretory pathway pseudopilin PulG